MGGEGTSSEGTRNDLYVLYSEDNMRLVPGVAYQCMASYLYLAQRRYWGISPPAGVLPVKIFNDACDVKLRAASPPRALILHSRYQTTYIMSSIRNELERSAYRWASESAAKWRVCLSYMEYGCFQYQMITSNQ